MWLIWNLGERLLNSKCLDMLKPFIEFNFQFSTFPMINLCFRTDFIEDEELKTSLENSIKADEKELERVVDEDEEQFFECEGRD